MKLFGSKSLWQKNLETGEERFSDKALTFSRSASALETQWNQTYPGSAPPRLFPNLKNFHPQSHITAAHSQPHPYVTALAALAALALTQRTHTGHTAIEPSETSINEWLSDPTLQNPPAYPLRFLRITESTLLKDGSGIGIKGVPISGPAIFNLNEPNPPYFALKGSFSKVPKRFLPNSAVAASGQWTRDTRPDGRRIHRVELGKCTALDDTLSKTALELITTLEELEQLGRLTIPGLPSETISLNTWWERTLHLFPPDKTGSLEQLSKKLPLQLCAFINNEHREYENAHPLSAAVKDFAGNTLPLVFDPLALPDSSIAPYLQLLATSLSLAGPAPQHRSILRAAEHLQRKNYSSPAVLSLSLKAQSMLFRHLIAEDKARPFDFPPSTKTNFPRFIQGLQTASFNIQSELENMPEARNPSLAFLAAKQNRSSAEAEHAKDHFRSWGHFTSSYLTPAHMMRMFRRTEQSATAHLTALSNGTIAQGKQANCPANLDRYLNRLEHGSERVARLHLIGKKLKEVAQDIVDIGTKAIGLISR